MKNYIKIPISFFCLFLLALACTKEVGLITEVEFELSEQHTAEGYVNQGLPSTFTIVPEEVLENYEYTITYEILDGEGHFEDMEGNRVEPGKGWPVSEGLSAPLVYMGSKTGGHRVKITGADNFGISQDIEVSYELSDVPVVWEASSELSELELEKPVDVSLVFERLDTDLEIGYQAVYGLGSGAGSLVPSEENGYAPGGEYGPIVPGTYPLVFTPSEIGPQQLVFTLRDSNGQEIEAGVDFNVVEFIEVISITLSSQDTIKMKLGDEIPPAFTFDPPNATDQEVTVVSSDPDVVFIDENNVCIAVGLGTAEVTVTSVSNPDASDTVTVEVIPPDRVPVTGISVSQADPGATGAQRQLAATVLPENATDPSVTWSSADDTIATVDENGLLTGLSAGTVTITATSVSDPEVSGSVLVEITGVSLQSANDIEAFALNGQIETATIDTQAHTVSVTVPEGTPLNVAPVLLIVSEGATLAPALLQERDFTSPVQYTVTSGNGTGQVWTVTAKVLVLPVAGDTDITAFGLPGQNGSDIDTGNHTITVNVPDGTDLNIAPEILEVSPGASVAPAIGQVRDFSGAVAYTVTPETGTPQVWTVNVTVSQPTGSGENAITAFELPGQTGADINATTFTINVTVPDGTDLTGAPSVLDISADATVSPARTVVQDFSGAVTYTVTAENGDTQEWTVNTTVLPPTGSGANDITAFGLPVQNSADIDPGTNTVTVNVPDGTDLNVAPQVLGVSPGATVLPAIGAVQDFSGQVLYTVTAENGTPQVWTVNVTVSQPTGSGLNAITGFELPVQNSVAINDVNHTITVNVPNGTDLNVVPSILDVSIGAGIDPGPASQQDFSQPVNYTVTAENGNPQVWTVNVVTETSGEKSIDSFVIDGVSGTFNGTDISVTLPFGTDVTALSPIIEFFGQSVNPPSGTPTDFTNNVTYTVTAEDNTTLDYTVNVTVDAAQNVAPQADAGPDRIITLPTSSVTLDGSGSSDTAPGTIASYAWTQVNGPTTATIVSARGASTSVTGLTIAGDYTFRLTVTDNGTPALSDTDDIIVTVDAAQNVAPQADAGPDRTITLPASSVTLDGSGSSDTPPGTIVSYAWTQVNGPTTATIVSASGASTSVTGLTIAGDYTFRLTVTDNGTPALSDTDDIIVTVDAAQNVAPQADAGPDRTITLPASSVTLDGSGSSDTPPGTIVSYAWTQVNGPTTATIVSASGASTSVTGLTIAGDYTFRLTVTDNGTPALSGTDDIIVTVDAAQNVAPQADAGPDRTITLPTSSVTLDGSGSSDTPPGTIASYAWTQVNGPTTATIVSASGASTSVTGLTIAGDYTFRLTVTDNGTPALSDTDDIIVTVDAAQNVAPQADAGPDRTITLPTSSVTLDGSGSSDTAPGTIASYAWTQVNGPTTATIVSASGASTSVTGLTIAGDYTFRLTVTDNGTPALSGTDDIIVTVDAAQNVAPQADAGPDRTITLPTSSVTLDGSGSSDTAPGTIASYAWTQVNGPTTATIVSASGASTSVTGLTIAGDYTFRLTVTDNGTPALSGMDNIIVKVNPAPNDAPVARAGLDRTITLPANSVTLDGSGSSDTPPGTIASYAWTQVNGPTTATIVSASSASTSVTGLTIAGDYFFRLTVIDNNGAQSNDLVVVTVNPLEPRATFSNGSNVSCSNRSITGRLTIVGGPIAFQLSAFGGSGGTFVTAIIDGSTYYVSAPAGGQGISDETPPLPPGEYDYTLSGSFSGCSGNGGSIVYK